MPGKSGKLPIQKFKVARIYLWSVLITILMYLIGALFSADPFNFWQHALSEIGTTKTLLAIPNLPSVMIVMTGMFITGRLLLEAARIYRNNSYYPSKHLKSGLLYPTSLGAFIYISPNNLIHMIIHRATWN